MRLLKLDGSGEFSLVQVPSHDIFPYAILSHTWIDGQEVTYQDIINGAGRSKTGYKKIKFCGEQASKDGLRHFWVDTCCIDKSNHDELNAAIYSMFRWYRNATKCYVYLTDVSVPGYNTDNQANQITWEVAFRSSRWFTRGWTLQELIAPAEVEFFSQEGNQIGDKKSLENLIHEITRIPFRALQGRPLSEFSVAERKAWAKYRKTKEEEDIVYCLIGLCEVSMPIIYGEGKNDAMKRLQMTVEGFFKDRSDWGEKFVQIRRWLFAPDPLSNYQKALKLRQPETGLWFLKSELYSKWKRNASSFLWLYGIPGCGKTILSSSIIQDIRFLCTNDTDKAVAYFYFNFNDVNKQKPELMVRSLIVQLSEQCTKMPIAFETLYSSCDKGNRQLSLDILMNVLKQMLQNFPESYLILDALDECAHRIELMEILKQMASWKLDKMRVLVTSRKERDIESPLENIVIRKYIVSFQNQIVDKDIQLYVHQRLLNDPKLEKWQKDADVKLEIETTLTKGSCGMFRWAACQMDALGKCRTKSDLRKDLKSLPTTLDETYERILNSIANKDLSYAMCILQWLVFASRPLSAKELSEAVAIDVEREKGYDRDNILQDPMDVLDICSSLVSKVVTDKSYTSSVKSPTVTLAHSSVREYLVSERICNGSAAQYSMRPDTGHGYIAKGCIIYLLQFEVGFFDNFETAKSFQEVYALAQYSAENWIDHTRNAEEHDNRLINFAAKLVSTNSTYLNWLRLYNPDQPWEKGNFRKQFVLPHVALYYVALGGLVKLAGQLIESGAAPNAQGGIYSNALQAASAKGYDKIIELLLNNSADPNAQGGYYGNSLQAASAKGNNKIVELLLSNGADPNAQGGTYGNSLYAASANGYDKIVELLLRNGADPNAQGGVYGNVLQAASYKGYNNIVELLLSNGADPNTQGGDYGNVLQVASAKGYDRIVELLLSNGADPNAQGGLYDNALHAASAKGYYKIVELLLSNGADPNAQGGYYGNVLQAASAKGYDKIVELLLSNGADLNAQRGVYGNALQAASYKGHNNVVELLLGNGADPNAQGGTYDNVLQAASANGHNKIVELLLRNSADPNVQGGVYGNVLQAASAKGYDKIVELLLSNGADPNAQGGHYSNALQAASYNGHNNIVELLLRNGADPNAQKGYYGNALQAASANGHDKIVELLLINSADPNAQGGRYGNALQATSAKGHNKIVELLLSNGADPNAQGGRYGNALQAASANGHNKIVKLLLSNGADLNLHKPKRIRRT